MVAKKIHVVAALACLLVGMVATGAATPEAEALFLRKIGRGLGRATRTVGRGFAGAGRTIGRTAAGLGRGVGRVANRSVKIAGCTYWVAKPKSTIDCLAGKVKEGVRKLRQYATGEISRLIAAFRGGAKTLVDYALSKLPPPQGPILRIMAGGGSWPDKLKKVGDLLIPTLQRFIDAAKKNIEATIVPPLKKLAKPAVDKIKKGFNKTVGLAIKAAAAQVGFTGDDVSQIMKLAAGPARRKKLEAVATKRLLEKFVSPAVACKVEQLVDKGIEKVKPTLDAAVTAGLGLAGSVPFVGGALAVVGNVAYKVGFFFLKKAINKAITDAIMKGIVYPLGQGGAQGLLKFPGVKRHIQALFDRAALMIDVWEHGWGKAKVEWEEKRERLRSTEDTLQAEAKKAQRQEDLREAATRQRARRQAARRQATRRQAARRQAARRQAARRQAAPRAAPRQTRNVVRTCPGWKCRTPGQICLQGYVCRNRPNPPKCLRPPCWLRSR